MSMQQLEQQLPNDGVEPEVSPEVELEQSIEDEAQRAHETRMARLAERTLFEVQQGVLNALRMLEDRTGRAIDQIKIHRTSRGLDGSEIVWSYLSGEPKMTTPIENVEFEFHSEPARSYFEQKLAVQQWKESPKYGEALEARDKALEKYRQEKKEQAMKGGQ